MSVSKSNVFLTVDHTNSPGTGQVYISHWHTLNHDTTYTWKDKYLISKAQEDIQARVESIIDDLKNV